MKVNWLMDDLAVRSQVGVESEEFRVISDVFWPIWGHFCGQGVSL